MRLIVITGMPGAGKSVAVQVARQKEGSLLGKTLKLRVKEIMGTCVSMGVTVEGLDPREAQKKVDQGAYDDRIK